MPTAVQHLQSAIKYEVEVREQGRVAVQVPFAPGARVTVFVIHDEPADSTFDDLVSAAESSLGFWDNPLDDEDWNNA
ncbi:MAG: hypothetical protein R3E79_46080 [Caldilineaceae bacterium]